MHWRHYVGGRRLHHPLELPAMSQFRKDLSTDADLLAEFRCHQDERAFAEILRRHGPMVMGLCRSILQNHHDVEDAFQATFLVLAMRSRGIKRESSVASWLYKVAYRTAMRAAKRRQRQRGARRSIGSGGRQRRRSPAVDPLALLANHSARRTGGVAEQLSGAFGALLLGRQNPPPGGCRVGMHRGFDQVASGTRQTTDASATLPSRGRPVLRSGCRLETDRGGAGDPGRRGDPTGPTLLGDGRSRHSGRKTLK